ncbi:EamA/RhaT family transporter [Flavobacterium sp. ZT3P35]|uniref:EamA family transporter n=2 Tax=unclassified Flavobacterium TaxID=196869 RepID=UPI003AACBF47
MLFLILSVICSVTVGILFKIARKYTINHAQIVAWNYVFAILFCYATFSPDITKVNATAPWELYGVIGFLLPIIFLFLAASIKHMGIVKTDAAQRLSLFIPILSAWLIFNEQFSVLKIVAFVVAVPALLLILSKSTQSTATKWVYPAVVLIGFGLIDILFKQISSFTSLPYTTSLFVIFGIAMTIMIAVVAYEVILKKIVIKTSNVIFGALVGMFNFGNILFYLKAHQDFSESPSTVFAGMNLGVIVIGSLVGVLIFKEKLSKKNIVGLFLALLAIVLIVLSQV